MRRAFKYTNSEILTNELTYPRDKVRIREVLVQEQSHFCAYTDEKMTAGYSIDVEHFNPTIKNTTNDNYNNWFAVSTRWNKLKGTKNAIPRWDEHQPLINPTDEQFESIVLYNSEDHRFYSNTTEGKKLIDYLNLNHNDLVEERKNYIKLLNNYIAESKPEDETTFLINAFRRPTQEKNFPRVIKEVFNINITDANN